MASDNLKHCRWCKHTMLIDASVCQQCRYGQSTFNKPGLSKILEIVSIVFALGAALFAWQKATDAADSLSQSEQLSIEFKKQENSLTSLGATANALQTDADDLTSIVADSLRVMYSNTMAELATDSKLLELLCPSELTEASLRLDCDIRHVDFSAKAVIALESLKQLSPAIAQKSNIDKQGAIATICGYQPDNIPSLFDAGDYVMGLENFVPFQNLPEVQVEGAQDIPTEYERQRLLGNNVISLYKEQSNKWASGGKAAYENLKTLCS